MFCSSSAAGTGSRVPEGLRSGVSCGSRLAARGWPREQRLSPGLRRCRAAPTGATARAGGRPLLGAPHPRRWAGAGQAAAVPGTRLAAARGRAQPSPSRPVLDGVRKFPARPRRRTDCWRPLPQPAPRRPSASPRLRFSLAAAWSFLPPLLCSGGSPPPPPQGFSSGHCPALPPPWARTARSQRRPIPAVFCSQLRLGLSLAFLSFLPPTPASPLPSPAPASTLDGSPLPRPRSFHTSSHSSHSSLPRFKLQGK